MFKRQREQCERQARVRLRRTRPLLATPPCIATSNMNKILETRYLIAVSSINLGSYFRHRCCYIIPKSAVVPGAVIIIDFRRQFFLLKPGKRHATEFQSSSSKKNVCNSTAVTTPPPPPLTHLISNDSEMPQITVPGRAVPRVRSGPY